MKGDNWLRRILRAVFSGASRDALREARGSIKVNVAASKHSRRTSLKQTKSREDLLATLLDDMHERPPPSLPTLK